MRLIKLLTVLGLLAFATHSQAATERCGWFENPTPANAWLIDRDGQWIIATQGGQQADGDWPAFGTNNWVRTNDEYGYGCACVTLMTITGSHTATKITNARVLSLNTCRRDSKISGLEPYRR